MHRFITYLAHYLLARAFWTEFVKMVSPPGLAVIGGLILFIYWIVRRRRRV
jgi:hypothetical protein